MQLAFILYKYFPFGGLQRDFLRIAQECQNRGHLIRVYTMSWQGDIPRGFEVIIVPIKAFFNHNRNKKFTAWVEADLIKRPVDKVIGFNKMPGLDIYYAADPCFEDKAQNLRHKFYRKTRRYKHFYNYEKAVFSCNSKTQILMISALQQPLFIKYYQTPAERFHLLPPGITTDRKAPINASEIRAAFRQEFNIADNELLIVQIGSGFKTKGLDRSLKALANLPVQLKKRTKLIVIGQDEPRNFILTIKKLGLSSQIQILKGRNDIPRFLLGADILIHPAYNENTGTILLEAMVAGLPVLVTDVCGYAHYIQEADCGIVIASPFMQTHLNQALITMLEDNLARQRWQKNGLAYAEKADIYSMPAKAADIILGTSDEIRTS